MSRLTAKQLNAVCGAVEVLCGFALCDTANSIRDLISLDSRIRAKISSSHDEAIEFSCGPNNTPPKKR